MYCQVKFVTSADNQNQIYILPTWIPHLLILDSSCPSTVHLLLSLMVKLLEDVLLLCLCKVCSTTVLPGNSENFLVVKIFTTKINITGKAAKYFL